MTKEEALKKLETAEWLAEDLGVDDLVDDLASATTDGEIAEALAHINAYIDCKIATLRRFKTYVNIWQDEVE